MINNLYTSFKLHMANKKDILDIIDKTCGDMNSCIRFLTRVYHNKINNDESYRMQKTLNTAISADPTVVMNKVGPYLLKYAKQISTHEEKFFLSKEWDDDINNEKEPDKAMGVIMSVKTVYETCNDVERNKIMETVSDMLSHFCEYKLAVDNLACR